MSPRHPMPPAVAALLLLAACAETDLPKAPLPVVYVTPVRAEADAGARRFTAVVAPRVESELSFRVGGKVTARLVDVGQTVRAGAALARLDPDDERLAVDAAAQQARAAEVDATQAASDAARFGRLLADGSIGAAEQERQQARADAAAARLAQARRQLDLARNRAGYAQLVAPFDGVVTAVRIEVGQVVGTAQPAVVLARSGELEVAVDIPERLVGALASRQASIAAGGDGVRPVPMALRELAASADAATRSYRARYVAARGAWPAGLRLGMTTELTLQADAAEAGASVSLPASALVKTGVEPAVWAVRDLATGAIERLPVAVVGQDRDRVRVQGLADGTLVVTAGAFKLDPAMRVRAIARPLDAPLAEAVSPAVRP